MPQYAILTSPSGKRYYMSEERFQELYRFMHDFLAGVQIMGTVPEDALPIDNLPQLPKRLNCEDITK